MMQKKHNGSVMMEVLLSIGIVSMTLMSVFTFLQSLNQKTYKMITLSKQIDESIIIQTAISPLQKNSILQNDTTLFKIRYHLIPPTHELASLPLLFQSCFQDNPVNSVYKPEEKNDKDKKNAH